MTVSLPVLPGPRASTAAPRPSASTPRWMPSASRRWPRRCRSRCACTRRRAAAQPRAGVPVRAGRAVRHQAVAAVPPPAQARRRRPGRRRAAPQVGLLLRRPRCRQGADDMAEVTADLTPTTAAADSSSRRSLRASDGRAATRPTCARRCRGPAIRETAASATQRGPAVTAGGRRRLLRPGHDRRAGRGVRLRALRATSATSCADTAVLGLAGLRRADRGGRPARGRRGPRPRVRRRRRRADPRQRVGADRHGDRPRHDRRDARAGARQRRRRPA